MSCTVLSQSVTSNFSGPALQAPLFTLFSRQEYRSGLSCPPPGYLPDPGNKPASPVSPALQAEAQPAGHLGSPYQWLLHCPCFWKAPFEGRRIMAWTALPASLSVTLLSYTRCVKKVFGFTGITNIKPRSLSNPKRSPPSIMQDYPDSHNTKHCRWRIWQFTFLQNHVRAHHLRILRMGHKEDLSDGTERKKGAPIGPWEGGQTGWWCFVRR